MRNFNVRKIRKELEEKLQQEKLQETFENFLTTSTSPTEETTMSMTEPAESIEPIPPGTSVKFGNSVPPHYDLGGPHALQWHDIRELLMDKIDSGTVHMPYAIDIIAWDRALEYLVRAPFKNGLDDLHKARHYLNMLIAQMEERL